MMKQNLQQKRWYSLPREWRVRVGGPQPEPCSTIQRRDGGWPPHPTSPSREGRVLALLAAIFFLILSNTAFATQPDQPLPDPAQEARAVVIGNNLRCVVCQSESINDSQADMARDMRQLVRDKIRNGESDQQIYDYARARYGDFILLRPPLQPNTLLLWLSPLLFIGVAGGGVIWFLRRGAGRGQR